MKVEHHVWHTSRLGRDMGVRVYGHWGAPVLVFPTSGGDEWEFERQGMLDTLGHHPQAEALGQSDDTLGDGRIVRIGGDVTDKRLVDLQRSDRQPFQVGERRVAGAEVVDRQADAELGQAACVGQRELRVVHQDRFGDFDLEQ